MLYIYIFFFVANLLVGLFHRKSNLLILITNIFFIIFFVGSRNVIDLEGYMDHYAYGVDNYFVGGQVIFYHFIIVAKAIGLSFEGYRFVLSVVGLAGYYYFVKKLSPLPNLVYAAYMGYLLIMDDVQIRNFVGCGVFCVALAQIYTHERGWRIRYIILVILASLVHSSFWIYLIFLILPKADLSNIKHIKIIGLVSLVFSVAILFTRGFLNDYIMLFSFVDEEKLLRYSENATRYGGAVYMVVHVFVTFCIWWLYQRANFHRSKATVTYGLGNIQKVLQISLLLDIISMVLFPAVVFSITFYRLIRNVYLLNAVALSVGYIKTRNKALPVMALFLYTAVFFYFDLTSLDRINVILVPMFLDNIYISPL